jgi:hypothetical protein
MVVHNAAVDGRSAERARQGAEAVKEIRVQIDWLASQFLETKGDERVRLVLAYMKLKESLAANSTGSDM